MCSKKMIPVRGGLSRASIRVGREFVRLGRRTIFRHMARKRRKRASEAFPRAAKANRQLFFASKTDVARKRKALTVTEVQGQLDAIIAQRVAKYASIRGGLALIAVATR